ncbi:hypothetical protein [Niallia sp. NCCP-28]|uniref:hypothetical protein n=1 Tax=Niallia sp. NCCP-28 TaxID=2934712 RepID=UPI00208A8F37|nr:hypothetical protein [Niallia sp. NCCP-28]GKU84494.1 hypothetical protein NCCP28_38900 [Niallia sp. NCCP-28]
MKNPIVAFILAFFPGGGLFYIGEKVRGFLYGAAVFGLALLTIFIQSTMYTVGEIIIFLVLLGFIIYCISIIDTFITTSRYLKRKLPVEKQTVDGEPLLVNTVESERFYTIVLSFVPGLGHIQLGLMNRGLTLLTSFLGLGMMVLFVTFLTSREEFLVFLAFLPIIWIYGFFDAMQQFAKKQNGELLVDQTIFQDFEKHREEGKKSKVVATFLSIFPGAGHLYLGLQQRGIQLMAAFLFSIFILNELRMGIFLFLIPLIWFYSFFDGLQKASKAGEDQLLEDTPVISYLINHQKWFGVGLVLLGIYYLMLNILLPIFSPKLNEIFNIDLQYLFYQYFQTGIVCIILIFGGIYLLKGKKKATNK